MDEFSVHRGGLGSAMYFYVELRFVGVVGDRVLGILYLHSLVECHLWPRGAVDRGRRVVLTANHRWGGYVLRKPRLLFGGGR